MGTPIDLYDCSDQRQERLVLSHMPMVKRVALHLKARIPPFMELNELVQVGMLGLIEAARAFDPTRGSAFESFALSRIRGAMLDEVRRLSYLPRSAVSFNRHENTALHRLSAELGRQPTQAELAESMGKEIDTFQRERGHARHGETYSMEDVHEEVMNLADEHQRQPEQIIEREQLLTALTQSIDLLPERERLILSLYYVEEFNLKEIGEILGVSESRISQLLSAIAKKLRHSLHL